MMSRPRFVAGLVLVAGALAWMRPISAEILEQVLVKVNGDILTTLDVLGRQVGIRGIFSDWAATVTYYANCMGLK